MSEKKLSNGEKSTYLKVLLMLTSTMAFNNGDFAEKNCKPSSRYAGLTSPHNLPPTEVNKKEREGFWGHPRPRQRGRAPLHSLFMRGCQTAASQNKRRAIPVLRDGSSLT